MKKSIYFFLFLCLVLFVSSCIYSEETLPPINEVAETTIALNNTTTVTQTPEQIITSTTIPSVTVEPTFTLVPSFTNTPCAVLDFYSLKVGYPCNWLEEKNNYFSDGDNYFEVSLLDLNTNPMNACEYLAFQFSDRFGGPSRIFPYGNGCLLVPDYFTGDYEDWDAAFITSLENKYENAGLIVLWTNSVSFDNQVKIIDYPESTPHQKFISFSDEPLPYINGQTILEEYFGEIIYYESIVRTRVDPIAKGPDLVTWLSSATNYETFDEKQLTISNQTLSPFGYQLKLESRSDWDIYYSLWKDDEIIIKNIRWFWHMPPSLNESKDNFVLAVSHQNYGDSTTCLIVSNGIIEEMNNDDFPGCWYRPFFIGDKLVTLNLENSSKLDVIIDGTPVQSFSINLYGPGFYPSPFWISEYNGQWVLELNDKLFIDGEMLNASLGYDEIFNWRLLNGKPFYFFRNEGRIYLSYSDQILPVWFNYVEHYNRSCCTTFSGQYNIFNTPNSVLFLAERDGYWYIVKLNTKGE